MQRGRKEQPLIWTSRSENGLPKPSRCFGDPGRQTNLQIRCQGSLTNKFKPKENRLENSCFPHNSSSLNFQRRIQTIDRHLRQPWQQPAFSRISMSSPVPVSAQKNFRLRTVFSSPCRRQMNLGADRPGVPPSSTSY